MKEKLLDSLQNFVNTLVAVLLLPITIILMLRDYKYITYPYREEVNKNEKESK